jgi:hypothetical protein
MPYLKNLVGQVAPQALPDLRENSLYETLSFFYDQTGRFFASGGARMKLHENKKANRRISNVEGWNRFAKPF